MKLSQLFLQIGTATLKFRNEEKLSRLSENKRRFVSATEVDKIPFIVFKYLKEYSWT